MKNLNKSVFGLILFAALTRLMPHPWNFTAIGAMALFSGSNITNKTAALLIPITALFLSDLIIGVHSTMLFTYSATAIAVLVGLKMQNNVSVKKVILGSFYTSAIFFIISNLGVWLVEDLYPRNLYGLYMCFVAAIPFFKNQVFGDLFYSGILFSAQYSVMKYLVKKVSVTV